MPRETTLEKMAGLKPLAEGSRLTAAVASQISDGASAALVVSEAALKRYDLTPRARIHHLSVRGDDPVMMLSAPIPATAYALNKAGMSIDDIDVVEINRRSRRWCWPGSRRPVPIRPKSTRTAARSPSVTPQRHRHQALATLLNELERTGGRCGLQTMCEGGGTANVTIIERL